jgi:hypothetical protein
VFMRMFAPRWRIWFAGFGLLVLLAVTGCLDRQSAEANIGAKPTNPSPEALKEKIDRIVDYTLNGRLMSTRVQAAWQIVHGIEAFGRDLPIEHDGKVSSALEYLLAGGELKGWVLRPGDRGVISILEAGSKTGQGHPDQWLGYMSQCGDVKLDDVLIVGGKQRHIRDLLTEAQWDLYDGMEASWTLMAAVEYLPLNATWTSKDGSKWTMERLVGMEATPALGTGGCYGTHRLYALAIAVNRYVKETGTQPNELKGGWAKAYHRVAEGLVRVREMQRPDGSFSTGFFEKSTESADLGARLYAGGHTLEFVTVAISPRIYVDPDTLDLPAAERKPYELSDDWVVAGVSRLCDELNASRHMEPDCGSLYHAVHSLRLYRDLRFGTRRPVLAAN